MTINADKLRERIRKLLNMTEANGCTEDEADTAMRIASGLAAQLGIELDSLRPADAPKPKIVEKSQYKQMKVYEAYCAEAAAILYGVECNAPNFGKNGFWYTGREENIELAEATMLWLVRQVELLYKSALTAKTNDRKARGERAMTVRQRADFRASFKDACAQRVYQRAQQLVNDMRYNNAAAMETTGSSALVVAGHFDKLEAEITDFHRTRWQLTPEQKERIAAREEAERQDRLANPEKWAAIDAKRKKDYDEYVKREERNARRRKGTGPTGRSPKYGSGTHDGFAAGEQVRLRKEID